jgi:hypothetical protein
MKGKRKGFQGKDNEREKKGFPSYMFGYKEEEKKKKKVNPLLALQRERRRKEFML